ncbi:hypothetical protein DAPPUDRAFT_309211 [Daphnia pulex]|uniref:Peptidase S1 domain-containing protein n=1 Tax=Daphnia pulex TaxID=6669 RepID=E9HAS8_DAPPU|nr:hypothetical protein DAPPUDRAFT_309211 [Daphnia pulex]|eukprot:EFX71082.1 hypothetical protein DAPPUDRAFT_309211 [Daphnia pulex]
MKSVLLLISIACSVVAGLLPVLNQRIIGGNLATTGKFPYVVSIIENDRHFCGGFIYSNRWIVTTASCVAGKLPSALRIAAGSLGWNQEPDVQSVPVYNVYVFDGYNSTFQLNDIALLKLTKDIVFDSIESNANFVKYSEVNTDDLRAAVIGWGATNEEGNVTTELRYGEVYITESTQCGHYSEPEFKLFSMICASPDTIDPPIAAGSPCQYDEGSPLVQVIGTQHIAVGVMSKAKSCSLDSVSVYTRLSNFYSWLQTTAGQQPVPV